MTALLKIVKPSTKPQRATHTTVDTIMLTPELIGSWINPPFQRPLRVNQKLLAISEQIKRDGGVVPGVITIGVLKGERYLIDGMHRIHGFILTELKEGYVDVRIGHFDNMADMAMEFVELNSKIVTMRPDDVLRGLEQSLAPLQMIRAECPFVGYDMIRRGKTSPILSMSLLLRAWTVSHKEAPVSSTTSAIECANTLTDESAKSLIAFLRLAHRAWGRDIEYARLWAGLNLVLCMWLFHRLVLNPGQGQTRSATLTRDEFTKCLMALSASPDYCSWLIGRQLGDRDRAPGYRRLKGIFQQRLQGERGRLLKLPSPPWAA